MPFTNTVLLYDMPGCSGEIPPSGNRDTEEEIYLIGKTDS